MKPKEKFKTVDKPFKVMYKGVIKWLVGSFFGDSMASLSDNKDVFDPVQVVKWNDIDTVVICIAHDICKNEACQHRYEHKHTPDCDTGCVGKEIKGLYKCS